MEKYAYQAVTQGRVPVSTLSGSETDIAEGAHFFLNDVTRRHKLLMNIAF